MKLETGLRVASVALLTLLAACTHAPELENIKVINNESNLRTVDNNLRTFCMGRFLIDLPRESRLNGGSYKYEFLRIETPQKMTVAEFEREVESRSRTLQASKHRREGSLLRRFATSPNNTRVLAFWEHDYSAYRVKVEGYRWLHGTRFLLKDTVDDTRQDLGIDIMTKTLSRLETRLDSDIPLGPGFCFQGGFVANDVWEEERFDVSFRLPQYPDLRLLIMVFPKPNPGPNLIRRMKGALEKVGSAASAVNVIRSRDRKLDNYDGQEFLFSAPGRSGLRSHSFQWETQGLGYLQDPYMIIEMKTGEPDDKGNPQPASLSDQQALALWDSIIRTFRLRPTTPARKPAADAAPARLPLGEVAAPGPVTRS